MIIFLTILKWIGILLLSLLVFLLLLLLLVLFHPIYYSIKIDDMDVSVRVSYFLNALRFKVDYINGKLDMAGDLIFYRFYPKEDDIDETKEEYSGKKEAAKVSASQPKVDTKEDVREPDEPDRSSGTAEPGTGKQPDREGNCDKGNNPADSSESADTGDDKAGKKNFKDYVEKAIRGVKGIYRKAVATFSNVKEGVHNYSDDVAKEAYSHILAELVVLLRHLRLRRGHIDFTLGFEDPAMTGQLLALYSLVYPKVSKHLLFTADFEKKVYSGQGKAGGKIVPAIVVAIAARLFFDKNIRLFIDRR